MPLSHDKPAAFKPRHGFKYQVFYRLRGKKKWKPYGYARDYAERAALMQSPFSDMEFKAIILPKSFWPSQTPA